MNIYNLLRKFYHIKSNRLKIAAILAAHVFRRRYIGIFLDPIMACNLRCRMCYFSDENKRKDLHGIISDDYLNKIAKATFNRALKLQIGCSAEPTLYKHLPKIVSLGRSWNIPYISITSNGQLLTKDLLENLIKNGLNEVTLSMHGIQQTTYEYFMPGAKHDRLKELLSNLKEAKATHPNFKVRINYVMNQDNTKELCNIWDLLDDTPIDILQLRPIQRIGNSSYQQFDLKEVLNLYDDIIAPLIQQCKEKGIVCIAPDKNNIVAVDDYETNINSTIEDMTYYFVSPETCYKPDFDVNTDTVQRYHRRSKTVTRLIKRIFSKSPDNTKILKKRTKKQNYSIR